MGATPARTRGATKAFLALRHTVQSKMEEVGGKEGWTSPFSLGVGSNGGGEGYTDIKNILDQILGMNDLSLEDARKSSIHQHRMKPALFSVLCEIKEKTCLR